MFTEADTVKGVEGDPGTFYSLQRMSLRVLSPFGGHLLKGFVNSGFLIEPIVSHEVKNNNDINNIDIFFIFFLFFLFFYFCRILFSFLSKLMPLP